jgi:hypothetical protein
MEQPWRSLLFGCRTSRETGNNFVGSGFLINLVFRFLCHDGAHVDHMIVRLS